MTMMMVILIGTIKTGWWWPHIGCSGVGAPLISPHHTNHILLLLISMYLIPIVFNIAKNSTKHYERARILPFSQQVLPRKSFGTLAQTSRRRGFTTSLPDFFISDEYFLTLPVFISSNHPDIHGCKMRQETTCLFLIALPALMVGNELINI